MGRLTRILIIEDGRELGIRIATLLQERFDVECVIIQCGEEQLDHDIENHIGHISGLSLLHAMFEEPFPVPSFDLILKKRLSIGQIFISQTHRVPPRKFVDVRKVPMPEQCKGARKKSWYR